MTDPTDGWAPANDLERALAAAVTANQRREFFGIIVTAELYLPAFVEQDPSARQRFLTVDLFGQRYLPVFTSAGGLARTAGDAVPAYTVTTYAELKLKWPNDGWRLAINPGSPIDAYMTVDAVAGAARGDLLVPTAVELMAEARSDALATAATQGDGEAYLETLLDCDVFLPAQRAVAAGELLAADFPWHVTRRSVDRPGPGEPAVRPTIEVVTMPGTARADVPGVVVPFAAVILAWPEPSYQLAVVSGHRVVTMPGSHISSLAVTIAARADDDGAH